MWRSGKPEKDGRYLVLVDMNEPVICNDKICAKAIPMTSNFRDGKWCGEWPGKMEVTYWMEIPKAPSE